MVPEITARLNFPRDPRLLPRDHAKAMRDTLREAITLHHQEHIPRHFMPFASAKYRYRRRGKKYQAIKDRLGLPPLVSPRRTSGLLRDTVTTQRQVTATQHRARLIMRAPFVGGTGRVRLRQGQTKLTTAQRNVVQIVAEITAIAPDEMNTINRWISEIYTAKVDAFIAGGGPIRVGRGGARTAA